MKHLIKPVDWFKLTQKYKLGDSIEKIKIKISIIIKILWKLSVFYEIYEGFMNST